MVEFFFEEPTCGMYTYVPIVPDRQSLVVAMGHDKKYGVFERGAVAWASV